VLINNQVLSKEHFTRSQPSIVLSSDGKDEKQKITNKGKNVIPSPSIKAEKYLI
jgi:hypothetical protein